MFSSQGVKYTTYDLHYNVRVPQGVCKGLENTPVKVKETHTRYEYKTHVRLVVAPVHRPIRVVPPRRVAPIRHPIIVDTVRTRLKQATRVQLRECLTQKKFDRDEHKGERDEGNAYECTKVVSVQLEVPDIVPCCNVVE